VVESLLDVDRDQGGVGIEAHGGHPWEEAATVRIRARRSQPGNLPVRPAQ
jgi:hypothetical protein